MHQSTGINDNEKPPAETRYGRALAKVVAGQDQWQTYVNLASYRVTSDGKIIIGETSTKIVTQ